MAWKAMTIEEIRRILGKPNIDLGSVSYGNNHKEVMRDILHIVCYTQVSDSVVVIFKEYEDGIVVVNYAGKWKG